MGQKRRRNQQLLELDPQCQLPDTVAAGIAAASALHLSKCAYASRRARTLSQIVARVIQVYVIGDIGKAALELQLNPFLKLEVFG